MAPVAAVVQPVSISDSLTINLSSSISVDIGGVSGQFSQLKITSLNLQEQGAYIGTNPPNAVNANPAVSGGYFPFSAMSDSTVAAVKAAVAAIGADLVAGIAKPASQS